MAGGVMLTLALVKSVVDLADPANSYSGTEWFGLGAPLVLAIGFGLLGLLLMVAQWRRDPTFFRQPPEAASPMARPPDQRPRLTPSAEH